ncbi:MAG: FGGY-family carbohydrate kinase [Actinomycetes bacterium]
MSRRVRNTAGNGPTVNGPRILAIDLGTSAVKTIVWTPQDGVVARGHAPVPTTHPQTGWDEQDAGDWWVAVQAALDAVPLDDLDGVGLSSQRETFVCLDDGGHPLRPAILWSDGRAAGPEARFAWLQHNEPEVVRRTRWLAAPKDFVLHRLVGRLVTDTTLASRTDLSPALLPEIVEPRTIVGDFHGAPVVAGAGDRTCEALSVAASPRIPMVSWGTTANCSFPLGDGAVPRGWRSSAYVDGGMLAEAGLSAAGSALAWLAERVSLPVGKLQARAAHAPPGANGVIALPWLNGARAPWWRPDAQMTLIGAAPDTDAGDMACAIYEGVAHDLRRALAELPEPPVRLALVGGGAHDPVWQQILTGITGLPAVVHGGDSAAIGAAMLATNLAGRSWLARVEIIRPPEDVVAVYAELAKAHDAAAASVLGLST